MQNKSPYISSVIVLFVFLFSACTSQKAAIKPIQTPTWIKESPKDTNEFTYGIGISKTREDALNAALNDVVSKLGVKVKSSFTTKEIVDGYYSKSISSSDIDAYVAKIRVTNYSVLRSEKISYREFAVLIRVNNPEFYKTLKDDIKNSKNQIETKLENSVNLDSLSRYKIKKHLSKECDRLLSNSLIAHQLNKSFDKAEYFNFVSDIKENFYDEANSLRFFISADPNTKGFAEVIRKNLLENNFIIAEDQQLQSVKIILKSKDNIKSKNSIVKINIDIKVIDSNNIIGINNIIIKERYNNSRSAMYNMAKIHFEQDIKELGIENILGIGKNN